MKDLTPEQIREMFRDLGLEAEEQRKSYRQLGSGSPDVTEPSTQLFIRTVSSTAPEKEGDNAELA